MGMEGRGRGDKEVTIPALLDMGACSVVFEVLLL